MRLIDTDAVIEAIDKHTFETDDGLCLDDDITLVLEEVPTIEERKHGRWIPLQLSIAYPPYQCSCCFGNAPMVMVGTGRLKKGHLEALLTDYCPHCGADMRGGKGERNEN